MGLSVEKVIAASVGGTLLVGSVGVYLFLNGIPGRTPAAPALDPVETLCAAAKQERGNSGANSCLEDHALQWLKPSYCEAMGPAALGQPSRATCLRKVAVGLGDPKACKLAGSEQESDACLRELSALLEDGALCTQMSNSDQSDQCLDQLASNVMDVEACGRIAAERSRGPCISRAVDRGAEPRDCAAIADPVWRNRCATSATRRDGKDLCGTLEGKERGDCWNSSDRTFADFESACGGSADCLLSLGHENIAACAAIPDAKAFLRGPCFERAGQNSNRFHDSFCEQLPRADVRDECLDGLGRGRGHGDSCAKIKDHKKRTDCVFAAGKVDPIYCRALSDATERRRCIETSSFDTADGSICEGLEQQKRIECQRHTDGRLAALMARVR